MTPRFHSPNSVQLVSRGSIVAVALSMFVFGIVWHDVNLLAVGAAIMCFLLRRASNDATTKTPRRTQQDSRKHHSDRTASVVRNDENTRANGSESSPAKELAQPDSSPKNTDALVDE